MFINFAVHDLHQSVNAAWKMTPQEWWPLWSQKHGNRNKDAKHIQRPLTQDEVDEMRNQLDDDVRRERGD